MRLPDLGRVLESLSLGVLVLDDEARVRYWNRWLECSSGRTQAEVLGKELFELFPGADRAGITRGLKSVMAFGHVAYFSRKARGGLLPMPAAPGSPLGFERMEQSCVMGPLGEAEGRKFAYLIVEDVTEAVASERRLAELAMRDVLTGVANRRAFDERLVAELERSRRYGRSLAIVMLDLDHFKTVNDRYGHLRGDEVLRRAAAAWSQAVRAGDLLARYGGEEFCAILPEAAEADALVLADRLRTAVSGLEFSSPLGVFKVTASAGLAVSRQGDGPDDILRRADRALYKAKDGGRNRVEAAE